MKKPSLLYFLTETPVELLALHLKSQLQLLGRMTIPFSVFPAVNLQNFHQDYLKLTGN